MAGTETIQFKVSPAMRQELETEAARLNLSMAAYIRYLHLRRSPGVDTGRLDRHVREIFGKHGDIMRRLAE